LLGRLVLGDYQSTVKVSTALAPLSDSDSDFVKKDNRVSGWNLGEDVQKVAHFRGDTDRFLRFVLKHTKQVMFLEQLTLPNPTMSIYQCPIRAGRQLTRETASFLGAPNAIEGYVESFLLEDLMERGFNMPRKKFWSETHLQVSKPTNCCVEVQIFHQSASPGILG
jgi:hypothetical protein